MEFFPEISRPGDGTFVLARLQESRGGRGSLLVTDLWNGEELGNPIYIQYIYR